MQNSISFIPLLQAKPLARINNGLQRFQSIYLPPNSTAKQLKRLRSLSLDSMKAQTENEQDIKKSSDDIISNKQMILYQNEFTDFVLVEEMKSEKIDENILSQDDWLTIFGQQSFNGFPMTKIQATLLSHPLSFQNRLKLYSMVCNIKELKEEFSYFIYKEEKQICLNQATVLQIEKDINRTLIWPIKIPYEIEDWKQRFQNILYAYASLDSECGYTQGMNFIVCLLILFMTHQQNDPSLEGIFQQTNSQDIEVMNNEEEENMFWVLVFIMMKKNWRELFLNGTPGIYKQVQTLEKKVESQLPQLHNHLIQFCPTAYGLFFQQYYFTLFTTAAPYNLIAKIYDMFLIFGENFLHQLIVAGLKYFQYQILKLDDIGDLLNFFKNKLFPQFYQNMIIMKRNTTLVGNLNYLGLLSPINYSSSWVIECDYKLSSQVQLEEQKHQNVIQEVYKKGKGELLSAGKHLKNLFSKKKK